MNVSSRTETESTDELQALVEVCHELSQCKKKLGLYPPGHPRVEKAVEDLKQRLRQTRDELGHPFFYRLDVSDRDFPEGEVPSVVRELRLFCALHFIETITIQAEVDPADLLKFCLFMRENEDSPGDDDETGFEVWRGIELCFYLPEDMKTWGSGEGSLIGKATGLTRGNRLGKLLESMPGHAREVISKTVLRQDILGRIVALRQKIQKEQAAQEENPDRLDVVSEMLYSVLSESSRMEREELSAEKVETSLDRLLELLEMNVEHLNEDLLSYPTDQDSRLITGQIRDVVLSGMDVSDQLRDLDGLKSQLSRIFRIAGEEGPAAAASAGAESPVHSEPASDRPEHRKGEDAFAIDLPGTLEEIQLPLEEWRIELENLCYSDGYFRVFLHLLPELGEKESLETIWDNVLLTFQEKCSGELPSEATILGLLEVYRVTPRSQLARLIELILERLSPLRFREKAVAALLEMPGGKELFEHHLASRIQHDASGTFELLLAIRKSSSFQMKDAGQTLLQDHFCEPHLIGYWARGDLKSFLQPKNLDRILDRLPADRVLPTFNRVFGMIPTSEMVQVLGSLPEGHETAQALVLAALDAPSREVRLSAIENLGRYPGRIPLKTLESLIRHTSLSGHPDVLECRSLARALVRMQGPEAEALAREVLTARKKLLTYRYPKVLRKILAEEQSLARQKPTGRNG